MNPAALAANTSDSTAGLDPFGGPPAPSAASRGEAVMPAIDHSMTPYEAATPARAESQEAPAENEPVASSDEVEQLLAAALGQSAQPQPTNIIPTPVSGVAPPAPETGAEPEPEPANPQMALLQQQNAMLMAMLQQQQTQQNPTQELLQRFLAMQQEQQKAQEPYNIANAMRAVHLDPTNPKDYQIFQQQRQLEALQQQYGTLEQRIQEQQRQAEWGAVYHDSAATVDQVLNARVGAKLVQGLPPETRAHLAHQAAQTVWSTGCSYDQAAQAAVAPLLPLLTRQPAPTPATPQPPAPGPAQAMVGTGLNGRGSAARQPNLSFDELTRKLFR